MTRLPALLLAALAAACSAAPLEDPQGALARMEGLAAEGRDEEASELANRIVASPDVSAQDRAEAAFQGGEIEMARGRHARAFEQYRYVLENAPWSTHASTIEKRLFEIGRIMLFDESYSGFFDDRGRGVDALETLVAHFRSSDRADDALKLVGDYFASDEVGEYAEATLSYLRVVDEYPESEWAERCL
jgi:tetratricopeptide (TPR) repeat protein